MIEGQEPQWRNEEAFIEQSSDRKSAESIENHQPISVELGESDVIAESVRLLSKSTPEKSDKQVKNDREISERDMEIRHEIQDDPSESQAVPLGELIAGLSATTPILSKSKPEASDKLPENKDEPLSLENEVDESSKTEMSARSVSYSQAIKIGFITALCLIAVFILLKVRS